MRMKLELRPQKNILNSGTPLVSPPKGKKFTNHSTVLIFKEAFWLEACTCHLREIKAIQKFNNTCDFTKDEC